MPLVNKKSVHDFWNAGSCGEVYALGNSDLEKFQAQRNARYELEPYIHNFAAFEDGKDLDVLEIGVGFGADHVEWAAHHPKSLTGIDLTPRAIANCQNRFNALGLHSQLQVADAENLPFSDNSFDIVYSWGVLHHSPDTEKAFKEVLRVLKPNGVARIMIYNKWSLTGFMLWARYGLLKGHPLTSLKEIYDKYLESPGTKAYTPEEAQELCYGFSDVDIKIQLCHGDLLQGAVGQRHQGALLSIAKKLWPRRMIQKFAKNLGLFLLIEARK